MRRATNILNYITIVYGVLLVISGLLKLNGGFRTYEIHVGDKFVVIYNVTSILYIVLVNFMGGSAFFYHAIKTIKRKPIIPMKDTPEGVLFEKQETRKSVHSKLILISGFITLFTAVFFLIESFAKLAGFENRINGYGVILAIMIIHYIPFTIIPGILAVRNISTAFGN